MGLHPPSSFADARPPPSSLRRSATHRSSTGSKSTATASARGYLHNEAAPAVSASRRRVTAGLPLVQPTRRHSLDSHRDQPKRLPPCSHIEHPRSRSREQSLDRALGGWRDEVVGRDLPTVPGFLDLRVDVVDGAPAERAQITTAERLKKGQRRGRRKEGSQRSTRETDVPTKLPSSSALLRRQGEETDYELSSAR